LAEQNDLVDAFERGEDVYKIMASSIYVKAQEEITKDERFVGKTTILGCGYGMGSAKFKTQLKAFNVEIEEGEASRIIQVYRETYDWIPTLWKKAGLALDAMLANQTTTLGRGGILVVDGAKGIRLPNGLYVKYPNLRKITNEEGKSELVYDTKKGKAVIPNRIYGGKVIENVCQALARIVIGEQMLRVAKKYKVAMTVHDAIGCVVPEHEAQTGKEYVEMCMKMRPKWALDLPLNCEAGIGKTYGDC
jgi:DNA polymerase